MKEVQFFISQMQPFFSLLCIFKQILPGGNKEQFLHKQQNINQELGFTSSS